MTPPAESTRNTLDLAVDSQLVHDLRGDVRTLGVWEQTRAKIPRLVPAIRFHVVEDETGLFAQRMHAEVSGSSTNMPARIEPALPRALTTVCGFGWQLHASRYNRTMPITLSSHERARLKALAHSLEPAVRIGHAGVTPELVAEVDCALTAHGLLKVSIAGHDRDDRRALGDALAERVDGTPVHRVGKINPLAPAPLESPVR